MFLNQVFYQITTEQYGKYLQKVDLDPNFLFKVDPREERLGE